MSLKMRIAVIGVAIYLIIVFLLGRKSGERAALKNRLDQIAASGDLITEDSRLRRSFQERIFLPTYQRAVHVLGALLPVSGKAQKQLEERLRKAGKKTTAREYLANHLFYALLIVCGLFAAARFLLKLQGTLCALAAIYGAACYYVVAKFLLGKQTTQRKDRIENEMPEILDLLSVSVSAGLGFDQALQYVTEKCDGPFSEEMSVAQREIKLGRPRDEALKNLAARCEVEALNVFVSAIIQADTLGIAISNVLSVQAENVRQMQKQKIEEKAAKLPVKILIPLVLCIFPVMFIILLGPAVPNVLNAFSGL